MLNIQRLLRHFKEMPTYAFFAYYRGERLGSGIHRDAYAVNGSSRYVLKVRNDLADFSNVVEWEVYRFLRDTRYGELLAPCHAISPDTHFLIQSRTMPGLAKSELPRMVPHWMSDFKVQNWGRLNGRAVCHDYASCLILNYTCEGKEKRPRWWDASK